MYEMVDTPALIVDDMVASANIERMARKARAFGKGMRPHIKTHKSTYFAEQQIAAGSEGIMVAKLGEAHAMREAGLTRQSIGYPLIGPLKERRLRDLVMGGVHARVSVDAAEGLYLLQRVYQETGVTIEALVEVDTGMHRCGLSLVSDIVSLAERIEKTDGVSYLGITCFGGHLNHSFDKDVIVGRIREEDAMLAEVADRLKAAGLLPQLVSEGGTIPAGFLEELRVATEIRPGTYVFNDVATVLSHAAAWGDCAASVLTTVVSTPASDRAIIDAGSKALGLDGPLNGSYGYIVEHVELKLERLSEEHGVLRRQDGGPVGLTIGDRLRIIPNHVCPTVNLYDFGVLVRGREVIGEVRIDARGMVQ